MEFIDRALTFSRSTIIYGSLGRNPSTIKFYVDAIADLKPVSNDELIFLHYPSSRFLYVLIEPLFNTTLLNDRWYLVFTSHLNFNWNPIVTRLEKCHQSINAPAPSKSNICGTKKITPLEKEKFAWQTKPVTLDLTSCTSVYEAFLTICNFLDILSTNCEWSLSCPDSLYKNLLRVLPTIGNCPYTAYLCKYL